MTRHPCKRRVLAEVLEQRRLLSVTTLFNNQGTPPEWDFDFQAVELGVKFQADEAGYVEGVRFYKEPNDTGTHFGHLWDANGDLLGSVTFTNETTSGWQEADFANPIAINANQTYVISYYAPVARYAYNYFYFTNSGVTSADGVLTAPSSASSGGNGVYAYGQVGVFPNQTFMDLNYYVDVVFSTTPDHPPTAINLSNNSVAEKQPAGTVVGSLSSVDADVGGTTFTYSLVSGPGGQDNGSFAIIGNQLETTASFNFEQQSNYSIRVQSTDANGLSTVQNFVVNVTQAADLVDSRLLFYKGSSAFDQSGDSGAIATNKTALLPGGTATFANYSSYNLGINGIMIDTSAPITTLTAADFTFLVGNNSTPSTWATVAAVPTITFTAGAGVNGDTRIEITFPNNVIQNEWLQITMLGDADTMQSGNDMFYFGNAIGETGDSATDAKVTATDEIAVRANEGPATITSPYDFNRDGVVNAADVAIAAANQTNFTNALQLIQPPATGFLLTPAMGTDAGSTAGSVGASPALMAGPMLSASISNGSPLTGPVKTDHATTPVLAVVPGSQTGLVDQPAMDPRALGRRIPAIHLAAPVNHASAPAAPKSSVSEPAVHLKPANKTKRRDVDDALGGVELD